MSKQKLHSFVAEVIYRFPVSVVHGVYADENPSAEQLRKNGLFYTYED